MVYNFYNKLKIVKHKFKMRLKHFVTKIKNFTVDEIKFDLKYTFQSKKIKDQKELSIPSFFKINR